jgi:hypothetical protein
MDGLTGPQYVTVTSAEDLKGKEGYCADFDASGLAILGDGALIAGALNREGGVIMNGGGALGDRVVIGVGKQQVGTSAAVDIGAKLTNDTNGLFVTAASGEAVLAISLQKLSAASSECWVLYVGPQIGGVIP